MDGEPTGFFSTTPRLIGLVVEGRARAREHQFKLTAWLAHTVATLERAKKITPLDKLIGGRDVKPRRSGPKTSDELLSLARRWTVAIPQGGAHAR